MANLASKLRHRVTIEDPVYTSDLLGGFITAWNIFAVLWADVQPLGSAESVRSEKVDSRQNYRFVTRYVPGIHTKMRVKFKNKYYSIRSVINVGERSEMLEITASSEVK